MGEGKSRRVVVAPQSSVAGAPGQLLSVELADDEDVRWQWTHYPDGRSAVTGYEIVKRPSSAAKG